MMDEIANYNGLYYEDDDEIMRDVRIRKAHVSEMCKNNPRYWEESRARMEAAGWKFID